MSKALNITTRTSKGELVAHAKNQLGVELSEEGNSRDDLIAAVREAEKSLGITGGDDKDLSGEQNEDSGSQEQGKKKGKNPKRALIKIHRPPSRTAEDDDEESETHCVLGFNGKNFQLEYDQEHEVPWGVYDILNNAEHTRYKKTESKEAGKKVLAPYQRKRYSVTLLDKIY